MPTYAQAPYMTKPSAGTILTLLDKHVFVFVFLNSEYQQPLK